MKITIAHLYPKHLNIYGDQGNIDSLVFRLKQRKINVTVRKIHPQTPLKPGSFDLLFSGGGQDRHQFIIQKDLFSKAEIIKKAVKNNIPMLTICGSYQLFGAYFKPFKKTKLKGINIFNAYTTASKKRKINNILIKSKLVKPQTIIGFENHSGNTYLDKNQKSLGKVISGTGNNNKDKTEGAVTNNCIGSYLHGSLLPKNPHLTDWLIQKALKNKYSSVHLKPLDDQLEWQAHKKTINGKIGLMPRCWNWQTGTV